MAKITGVRDLQATFVKMAKRFPKDTDIEVGYSTPYAIYVHEDLQAAHTVGQAKFLEEPARLMVNDLRDVVARELMRGSTWVNALFSAAKLLEAATVPLVPVDTGLLRSTAFTRIANYGKTL